LFDDIKSRIYSLLEKRDPVKKSSADPKLIEGIDKRTGTILCLHLNAALGLIVEVTGDGSAAHKKAQCDVYKLQLNMKQSGFSQQIAPCLPLGEPIKPEGCP
jgi:hypothetical protein